MSHANDHKKTLTPHQQRQINADPQISNPNQDSNQQILGREYSIPNTLERADHLDPDRSNLTLKLTKNHSILEIGSRLGKLELLLKDQG